MVFSAPLLLAPLPDPLLLTPLLPNPLLLAPLLPDPLWLALLLPAPLLPDPLLPTVLTLVKVVSRPPPDATVVFVLSELSFAASLDNGQYVVYTVLSVVTVVTPVVTGIWSHALLEHEVMVMTVVDISVSVAFSSVL